MFRSRSACSPVSTWPSDGARHARSLTRSNRGGRRPRRRGWFRLRQLPECRDAVGDQRGYVRSDQGPHASLVVGSTELCDGARSGRCLWRMARLGDLERQCHGRVRAVWAPQCEPSNGVLNTFAWAPLSLALRSADDAVTTLAAGTGKRVEVERARAGLYGGFSLVQMADLFCQVVINGGPPITPLHALDSAVARLTGALDAAAPLTTDADASIAGWAREIVNASRVGRARAHLQAGRLPAAIADAQQVEAGFVSVLQYADNPAARVRLANTVYRLTADARTVVVPPAFRVSDPRVPWLAANGQAAAMGSSRSIGRTSTGATTRRFGWRRESKRTTSSRKRPEPPRC